MNDTQSSSALPQAFPPTRWSVVLTAQRGTGPEADAALEALCRAYWYPLYAFVRRCRQSPQDAQDITQEFFQRLLEKHWLEDAEREKGRLRTFLITALKRFMAHEWRRANAQKRGGGRLQVPIDTSFAESRYAAAPSAGQAADEVFDRDWALRLLELTMERLQAEFTTAGKANDFEALKEFLTESHHALDYPGVAQRLGVSAGAARVAVHRLRKRFREVYREEIAQTLPPGADIEAEMHYLAGVLNRV